MSYGISQDVLGARIAELEQEVERLRKICDLRGQEAEIATLRARLERAIEPGSDLAEEIICELEQQGGWDEETTPPLVAKLRGSGDER